jgi:hypothetical protein
MGGKAVRRVPEQAILWQHYGLKGRNRASARSAMVERTAEHSLRRYRWESQFPAIRSAYSMRGAEQALPVVRTMV